MKVNCIHCDMRGNCRHPSFQYTGWRSFLKKMGLRQPCIFSQSSLMCPSRNDPDRDLKMAALKCALQTPHPSPPPPSFGSAVTKFTGHAVQLASIQQDQIKELQEEVAL